MDISGQVRVRSSSPKYDSNPSSPALKSQSPALTVRGASGQSSGHRHLPLSVTSRHLTSATRTSVAPGSCSVAAPSDTAQTTDAAPPDSSDCRRCSP
uniref:Uncharacterized protein n=1 Tax=Knipowitschia caucasica TaxID=637954 RepID=A0AAV2LB76_KNICA